MGPVRVAAEYLVYAVFRCAWAIARVVPARLLRTVLEAAGRVVLRCDKRHRLLARENLRLAFPAWPARRTEETVRAAFSNWGRIVAELVHARELGREAAERVVGPAVAAIREAAAGGRGVLVLSAHTANFELLARMCCLAGQRVAVVNRPLHNRFVAGFLAHERARVGLVEINGKRGAVRQAIGHLAEGTAVVIPLDQDQPPGRGVFVEMFGRECSTSPLLARLSLSSGAPVVPVFAAWEEDGPAAILGKTIPASGGPSRGVPEGSGAREARVLGLTALYTGEIEAVVRRYPEQWNWAHGRWKTKPAAA